MRPARREHRPPAGLELLVECLWENEPETDIVQRVVPDGCVDIIWLHERELVITGADSHARRVPLRGATRLSGIRLAPGAAGPVLGIPASEVRDQDVPLALVWGKQGSVLADAIAAASAPRRLHLLAEMVAQRNATLDPLVNAAMGRLNAADARTGKIAAELGVSERQFLRRIEASVGYGPKMLARVARLRRLATLPDGPLAARALAAGYASQAHMNDEVRRLTGVTPVVFLADPGSARKGGAVQAAS